MQFKHPGWWLVAGLVMLGLLWAGIGLQRIFQQEYAQGMVGLEARRDTLLAYARAELGHRLTRHLANAEPVLQQRLTDPLTADDGLLWLEPSVQRLPRPNLNDLDSVSNAREIYQALLAQTLATAEALRQERLILLQTLQQAVDANDADAIEQHLRAVLQHGVSQRLAADFELAFWTALLTQFAARIELDTQLLQGLLRDGIDDGYGNRLPGLQRELLRQRHRLNTADVEFLAARIAALSRANNVREDDFTQRVAQPPNEITDFPWTDSPTAFLWQQRWYVERQDMLARGIAVAPPALLQEIVSQMQAGQLLQPGEIISLTDLPDNIAPNQLDLQWQSESWQAAQTSLSRYYRLKTGLLLLCSLLAIGVVVFAWLAQYRQQRWLALKAEFIAAVSHELRTPLASLRVMAETLEYRLENYAPAKDYPQRMIASIDSLSFMVENILSFNRLSQGGWHANKTLVRPAEVIQTIRGELGLYTQKSFALHASGCDNTEIQADPALFKLLLMNLARNACHYNSQEQAAICIQFSKDKTHWQMRVKDNGVGISETDRNTVFEAFVRGKTTQHQPGSGLGLALCRKIMRLHGGKIEIESSSDRGTTFLLSFPQ